MGRVTAKGQITIPLELRRRYGIQPGDEVRFSADADGIRVARAPGSPTRAQRAIAALRGRGDVALTTDEIMALTRGER